VIADQSADVHTEHRFEGAHRFLHENPVDEFADRLLRAEQILFRRRARRRCSPDTDERNATEALVEISE
jgi:hypothetical protein